MSTKVWVWILLVILFGATITMLLIGSYFIACVLGGIFLLCLGIFSSTVAAIKARTKGYRKEKIREAISCFIALIVIIWFITKVFL